jgi:CelD/BcsL family acetyltransferase involved in cellulose biosynthesis
VHVGSDYLDVIAVKGREAEVTGAFCGAIREMRGAAWDVLELSDVLEGSRTIETLAKAFPDARFEHELTARYRCPFQPLETGQSFDDFLKSTARRDNYLRRARWLAKQPGFAMEKTTAPNGLVRPMAEFFRLHDLRWAADGGSQGIRGPSVEAFHRDATQYLAERGWLRLYTLRIEDQALASVYGIAHRNSFIFYQSGYDPHWASKSVGLVLLGETFRDAIESRVTEYDFLRGTEPYKADWVKQERRTVRLRIWPKGSRGAWMSLHERTGRGLRSAAKAVLPQPVVEQVRRWRRQMTAP